MQNVIEQRLRNSRQQLRSTSFTSLPILSEDNSPLLLREGDGGGIRLNTDRTNENMIHTANSSNGNSLRDMFV